MLKKLFQIFQPSLRNRIFLGFLVILLVIGLLIYIYMSIFISNNVMGRTQRDTARNMKTAWSVYDYELNRLALISESIALQNGRISSAKAEQIKLKKHYDVDYIIFSNEKSEDKIIKHTIEIPNESLLAIDKTLAAKAFIKSVETRMAKKIEIEDCKNALALEAVAPVYDNEGNVTGCVKTGLLLNRNFELVDRIKGIIFEDKRFDSKELVDRIKGIIFEDKKPDNRPVGNVTIFLRDIRIATNVLTDKGERAIGTHISEKVYDTVITKGKRYNDRAFVVNDWYLTAYDPIKDKNGKVIGVLYIGMLERPFVDIKNVMNRDLTLLLVIAIILCIFISYWLALGMTKPISQVIKAVEEIDNGNLDVTVSNDTKILEMDILANSFNSMAKSLKFEKEEILLANEKLYQLNQNYLNMIGFVSHQLKGILGSIVMNVYSLKEGFLGELNEKQKKSINAVARIMDHFESMVKNYLDLSRIEKGELEVRKTDLDYSEDILKVSLSNFEKQITEKGFKIENSIPTGIKLCADKNLMMIVADNLIGNAIKYGTKGGMIKIDCIDEGECYKFCYYNEGIPVKEEHKSMLFHKFSRLPGSEKIKGTGVGLYIVKEIIDKHNGKIWLEIDANGNKFNFTVAKGA